MSAWGSFWSGVGSVAGTLWVYINRDVPYTEAIGQIIETRFGRIDALLRKIEGAFDLETATGEALDIWGARLGLERLGLDDATYRRALKVQRSFLLSGSGTLPVLLSVFEAWTGAAPVEVMSIAKMVHLAGDVDPDDESRLLAFLRAAMPGGRQVEVHHVVDGDLLCDLEADPIADAGTLDYEANPVAGAAELPGQIT